MFLDGMLGERPVLSFPARVFYHKAALFDVIFPGILVGESPTGKEMGLLGHGGFCGNCDQCHFAVYPSGKG